jgi:SpoVK/Ycf46/Vps4 family AAA+-type ATPase
MMSGAGTLGGAVGGLGGQMPSGMNQMFEIFKMQYLMKFLDGGGGAGGAGSKGSMIAMFVLMAYDQLIKYAPMMISAIWIWISLKVYGPSKSGSSSRADAVLLPSTQPPPATKAIKAFIQFERHPDKSADPRIDAVIYHVCNLPDVRSLRYNGVEMIPNFVDVLMIENDVWFEIINPGSGGSGGGFFGSGGLGSGGLGGGSGKSETRVEPILYRLSTYDHDITWLHKFVEETMERFEQEKKNKLGSETYYFDQMAAGVYHGRTIFNKSKFTSNRTLNNVYLRQIDDLKQRVEFFMRRRDWYDSKGIPHTLGIVMYGVPGCGKTSTIKGIANETKRHIFNIMLSEIKTKEALKDLFYNEAVFVLQDGKTEVLNIPLKHRLYVIEDIDAMDSVVVKRSAADLKKEEEKKIKIEAEMELLKQTQGETMARNMMHGKHEDKDKLDLATLLNVLDGVRETPGRIIILSTNYPERLDEALLRPGRFDMMLEFEKHGCKVLQQHLEKHYDIELSAGLLEKVYNPSLEKKWTPAEVSQILFRRIGDVDGAIDDLLKEDPLKLFKFSQMKGEAVAVEAGEDLGTDLYKLLEESITEAKVAEPVVEEVVKAVEPVVEEVVKTVEPVVEKVVKAEPVVVEVKTNASANLEYISSLKENIINRAKTTGIYDLGGKYTIDTIKDVYDEAELQKIYDHQHLPSNQSVRVKIESKYEEELEKFKFDKYRQIDKKLVEETLKAVLESPMFKNNDGFTAMNDDTSGGYAGVL